MKKTILYVLLSIYMTSLHTPLASATEFGKELNSVVQAVWNKWNLPTGGVGYSYYSGGQAVGYALPGQLVFMLSEEPHYTNNVLTNYEYTIYISKDDWRDNNDHLIKWASDQMITITEDFINKNPGFFLQQKVSQDLAGNKIFRGYIIPDNVDLVKLQNLFELIVIRITKL